MSSRTFFLFILGFFMVSCGGGPQQDGTGGGAGGQHVSMPDVQQAFFDNLSGLCGSSFRGEETYMAPGRESWAGKDMVMHVTLCEPARLYIPFHLGEDHSRTWMFLVEDGRLRFRHDHRYPDGTPEELTMYGGYANDSGTPFRQHFPADEYTIELLTDTLQRQWNVVMDEGMQVFSYQLQYKGVLVFQADFDLTQPL